MEVSPTPWPLAFKNVLPFMGPTDPPVTTALSWARCINYIGDFLKGDKGHNSAN